MARVNLGEQFPNFEANTTIGKVNFYDWLGDSWGILFSHPKDYTPVCTTELGRVVELEHEFQKRGVKHMAMSCDTVEDHLGWSKDVMAYTNIPGEFPYPIIGDPTRELAVKLGMLDPELKDDAGLPLTCRAIFVIGPDKKLKLSILYPVTTGRNFKEILRVIDSLQLAETNKVATPADWEPGQKCMVDYYLTDEEARKALPKGFERKSVPSGKGYMRFTPDPK